MTSERPEISIVLPFFNAEKFLKETLESLLNQGFQDFELLAINDHSTDKGPAIVEEFCKKDKRVKLIVNKNKKGLAGALNTGLELAKGKYIARADADDIYLPDRLKDQYEFLEKNSDIMLVGSGYAPYDGKNIIRKIYHPTNSEEIAWRFLTNTFFCHPSVMFRQSITTDVGFYHETGAEDFELFSRIIHKYKTANLRKIHILYRQHDKNASNINKDRIKNSVMETYKKNFTFYFGNSDGIEKMYRFREENILKLSDLKTILDLEKKMLSKISATYHQKIPLSVYIMLYTKTIKALLKT